MGLLYISLGGHLDIPIIKQGHFGHVMFALNPKNGIALPRMDACKQVKYFFEEKGSIVFFLEAKVIFFQKISRRFSQSRVCEVYWKFLLLSFHNQMQLGFRAWLKGFKKGKKGRNEGKGFRSWLTKSELKIASSSVHNACFYDWWKIKSQFLIGCNGRGKEIHEISSVWNQVFLHLIFLLDIVYFSLPNYLWAHTSESHVCLCHCCGRSFFIFPIYFFSNVFQTTLVISIHHYVFESSTRVADY